MNYEWMNELSKFQIHYSLIEWVNEWHYSCPHSFNEWKIDKKSIGRWEKECKNK